MVVPIEKDEQPGKKEDKKGIIMRRRGRGGREEK